MRPEVPVLQRELESCLTQIDAKIQEAIRAETMRAKSQAPRETLTSFASENLQRAEAPAATHPSLEKPIAAVFLVAQETGERHTLAAQVVQEETHELIATKGSNIGRYNQLAHFLRELPSPSLKTLGKLMLALSAALTTLAICTLPTVIGLGAAGLMALTFGAAGAGCTFFGSKPPTRSASAAADELRAAATATL